MSYRWSRPDVLRPSFRRPDDPAFGCSVMTLQTPICDTDTRVDTI